jgi:hypothetical protein
MAPGREDCKVGDGRSGTIVIAPIQILFDCLSLTARHWAGRRRPQVLEEALVRAAENLADSNDRIREIPNGATVSSHY